MSNNRRDAQPAFRRHDFVETAQGLIFAVVSSGVEEGRVLCFLRYVRSNGRLEKFDTTAANALLQSRHAEYVFHSPSRDATLHGVPAERIAIHHRADVRAAMLAAGEGVTLIERRCARLIHELTQRQISLASIGVTGSLLIGAQTDNSDIDLVMDDRDAFHRVRGAIHADRQGGPFAPLSIEQWKETYRRRGCALSFDEYLWHEQRKNNKAVFEGTKFDISQGEFPIRHNAPSPYVRKLSPATIVATVTDDADAFAFPARWHVDHKAIAEVVAVTPTYTGQAILGESIEAAGMVEELANGGRRLVIGSSREAPGEWIKVIQ